MAKKTFKNVATTFFSAPKEQPAKPDNSEAVARKPKTKPSGKVTAKPAKKGKPTKKASSAPVKKYLANQHITVPAGYKLVVQKRERRVQLVLQESLYDRVKAKADKAGISLNSFIHALLEEKTK